MDNFNQTGNANITNSTIKPKNYSINNETLINKTFLSDSIKKMSNITYLNNTLTNETNTNNQTIFKKIINNNSSFINDSYENIWENNPKSYKKVYITSGIIIFSMIIFYVFNIFKFRNFIQSKKNINKTFFIYYKEI